MRLNKSHYERYIYLLILLISSFYVVIALDLSRHWSSMIDMDIVVVYNSLLLNSGLKSEYFDQPSHTLLLINSYFYSLLDLINLIKVSNYNEIINSNNLPNDYQNLFFYSRLLNGFFIFCFSYLFFKIGQLFDVDNFLIFLIVLLFIFSNSILNIAGILRTEITSALFLYTSLYFFQKSIIENNKKKIYLILLTFFMVLSVFSKYLSLFVFCFLPLLTFFFKNELKINYENFKRNKYENTKILAFINFSSLIVLIFLYQRYTEGFINYFFIPIIILSFIITFYIYKKIFRNNFDTALNLFYLNIGLALGFFLLLTKPFSTTNIGIVFNGIGFATTYNYTGANPYGNDLIDKIYLLLKEIQFKNIKFIKDNYFQINVDGFFLALNIIGLIYFFIKKNYYKFLNILIVLFIFLLLSLILSLRPSANYLIFITPLLIFNIFYVFSNINFEKKFIVRSINLIFIILVLSNLNVKNTQLHKCINYNCCENPEDRSIFIRDWQRRFTQEFIVKICKLEK